jgi:eukaryotic-like serine/threonine-protein kinase
MGDEAPSRPDFQILLRLGAGGMADVHLAWMRWKDQAELVALKRMRVDLTESPEAVGQFEREARLGALLVHPNLVALKHWGLEAERPFLALEFVNGRSASALLKAVRAQNQTVPLPALLWMAQGMVAGLRYAHEFQDSAQGIHGILHRDISPENLLIGFAGTVKVADFGIAKAMGSTVHTRTGTLKGKFGYLAPEQLDGTDADVRSEVFAFGATLFYLTTGTPAFQGKTEGELVRSVLAAQIPDVRTFRKDCPPPLLELIRRCLAKSPGDRPQTLADVQSILEPVAKNFAARPEPLAELMQRCFPDSEERRTSVSRALASSPGTLEAPVPGRSTRAMIWFAALAVAAAIAGSSGYWIFRRPQSQPPQETKLQAPMPTPKVLDEHAFAAPEPIVLPPPKPSHPIRRKESAQARTNSATGTLRVKVSPWAKVIVDGNLVGETPLLPLTLSTGEHTVMLVNETFNKTEQHRIRVEAGKETLLKAVLEQ